MVSLYNGKLFKFPSFLILCLFCFVSFYLRCFLSIALRILTAHDFRASLARANEPVHVHTESYFPQAKLDNEINVPFF